ncbi:uncharacterized protein MAL13P1.304-like isoform X2 [Ruditapes philippinarum]|uniref:uncharacterized protein MAL13P1.304-like isoform X2 n=1 Tax=Ruditapes philippinarum TaxID=129788 RepID=UPI00295B68F9|nr:uncharacterized protein MAL13P1.304-like isoform X2 [Ruditapes philippinarum]
MNDKTLEQVNVEDGQRSHESTEVVKTDEDELGKDDHDRSKNIDVASNDLNDRDNTDKKESDKESNVRNNSAGQDSKRVGSVEKRIENIDQNTTINESFQNTDADKKEISNRTTETLATVIAENEPRSHESTQLDKIDEHELDKNNHNTSKSVDAECNELNDRDIIDKKESGKESDVSNTSTGQDSKRVGSGKIRNKSTDQGTTIIVSLPNIDADKNENTNSIPETLETVIAADKEINHESTRIDKTDGYDLSKDTHGRSKNVDVECSDRDSLDKNKFYKTDDHKECADGRDIRSDVREDELYIPDDVKSEEKNSSGESFSQERSDSEILKEVADVNQPSEKETEYESENIIEEVRIKDGKSTLVLYKVKEKSLLNVERNDSGDIELKHKIANNDRHKSNIQPLDGDINHNTSFENEGSVKRSEIKTETSKEARHIVDKHKQDDVVTSVSAELSSQCINSHHDVINSENSLETNAKPNKTEISKGDSYIQSVNHNGGININQDTQENTSIEKESLSKNNINNDQMNTGISNDDKIQEKSINDDKNEGEVHFDKGKNVNDEKTGNDHLGNEIKHNTHDINSKQELTSDSYSDDRNAVISDQEKTDDMAVIKDEPATKVNYQEDGESGFSEDEKSDVGYEGKGNGKKETKLEPGTDNTEQPERRKSKKGMTAETSIASDRMLSSQARMILLMEKTKQTNENYGKEHIKTIKLFEETRGVFSDLEFLRGKGRGLQFRENSSEENAEITEDKEEPQTAPQDQEQVGDVDTEQNKSEEPKTETDGKENEEPKAATKETNEVKPKKKKVKLAAVAPPKLSDERIRQIREMYWSNGQGNSETFELDGEEYFLDPNGELVKSIKFNASKKIDTRWDPNHPMFKKLQNKNKGLEIKGIVQSVKAAKPLKLKTNDISSSNVYVTEAKRIYPKGFEEDKNAKTENKKVKRLKSFKTKSVDIGNTGQEVNDSLTRIETNDTDNAIKKKLNRNASVPNKLGANDKHFSQETVEGDVNKRKLRKTKSVSSKIAESKNESNNDNETPEVGKKLRVKTSKYNNFVDSEKDNVSVTTAESSKENKTEVIKKKKKLKHKSNSSKEFEDDYAFLREQNEFSESTVKLDETEIIRNSKETVIKKHPKPAHKKSLPDLEFQTKDEQFNKCSTPSDQQDENNITNPNENDQQSDEITASRKKTIKKRIKKKRTSSNNLHALKIFQEAREDLPRDLSIIKDTNEDNSQKVPKVKKVPVEYSSSSSLVSGKSDMSMQTAVEIMQSRGRFYGNPAGRNGAFRGGAQKRTKRTPSIPAI